MSRSDYMWQLYDDPERMMTALHPEVVWVVAEGFVYGGTYVGPEEITQKVFSRLATEWDGFSVKPEVIVDQGDVVAVLGTYTGKHKVTGKAFTTRFSGWYQLDADDRITRFEQVVDSATMNAAAA